MARIPRPLIAGFLYFFALATYYVLTKLAGSDPHLVRSFGWDLAAVSTSAVLVTGTVIGCFRALDAVLDNEGEQPWSVPLRPTETPPFKHAA